MLASILAGCGGSSIMLDPPTIPAPLINKIPASIGLRIPAEFESYVHEEEVLGRERWKIDLGRSNAALFTQLFEYMFEKVTVLDADDDASLLSIDALIEPSIDAFEFSVPNQTRTEAFAVWIRYRLKVYDSEGIEVANWPVSAYGKSQSGGGSDALRRAAVLAMRDAAALMIMKLDEQTGISVRSSSASAASVVGPTPQPAATDDSDLRTTVLEGSDDDTSQPNDPSD